MSGWDDVGRSLLEKELYETAEELRDAFYAAADKARSGEELTVDDVQRMQHAVEDAQYVTQEALVASPEAKPEPEVWDVLGVEAMQTYGDRVEEECEE